MRKDKEPESPATQLPENLAASDLIEEDEYEDDDLEFAFVVRDPDTGSSISADEIFFNGQIRPIYPIFNRDLVFDEEQNLHQPLRRLILEEQETETEIEISPPARSSDELNGISPESYCVWTPKSPERCGKSVSTGSVLRFRIRDLVLKRSHSDGKEKFVFLETEKKKKEKGKKMREVDFLPVNGRFYDRQVAGAKPGGAAAGRRTFLPYKPNIVGFFAGANGVRRVHHPF